MKVKVYREVAPIVKLGKLNSVIQDHGYLKSTLPASNGYYLFSETETGAMPIILLGTFAELLEYLSNAEVSRVFGIENRIKEIPDIYMGAFIYVPGERFTGLFPMHDFVYQLAKQAADLGAAIVPEFTPDSSLKWIRELVGGIKDLGTWTLERIAYNEKMRANEKKGLRAWISKKFNRTKEKDEALKKLSDMIHKPIYLKFHYFEEKGMKKVGKTKVLFKDLCENLQSTWKEMEGTNKQQITQITLKKDKEDLFLFSPEQNQGVFQLGLLLLLCIFLKKKPPRFRSIKNKINSFFHK